MKHWCQGASIPDSPSKLNVLGSEEVVFGVWAYKA